MKIFLIFMALFSHTNANEILYYGSTNWPPLLYVDKGLYKGIEASIIFEIQKNLSYPLAIYDIPVQRLIREIRNGAIEVSSGVEKTKLSEDLFYFSKEPEYQMSVLLISKKPLEEVKKVAISNAHFYGSEFENFKKSFHLYKVQSESAQIQFLLRGRTDAILIHEHPYKFQTRHLKKQTKDLIVTPLWKQNRYFVVSKKVPHSVASNFLDEVDREIRKLKSRGFIKKLLEKQLTH